MSIASPAQSTDSDTNTDTISDSDSSDTWSSDLKAPLRPADDVGGSWNWMLLYGRMTDASLVDDVVFNFGWAEAKLYSGEIGYTLKDDNPFVKFMDPVLSSVDVAMNVTYQDDPAGTIFVFSPYIMARWSNFPWSKTIRTTFGLGGGLSYATDVPSIEIDPNDPNGDYNRLLHYIAVEATFALPKYKDWQLVYRLHHRSGVFGLMQAENAGNTAIQIGIRHYFK
ncbi:MAG: hypothetical protein V3R72_05305 [Gammaproteobacteria bacterium]